MKKLLDSLKAEGRKLETAANERPVQRPARIPPPPLPEGGPAPPIPGEVVPEIGDLVEHNGRRYLAVSFWEQVQAAIPVAQRVDAELVATNS